MIAILKGGVSAEREVSLWTAQTVAGALGEMGRDFIEVDAADDDWLAQIQAAKAEVVLIALHGPFGEDGQVQRTLEKAGTPYTGSDSAVSALAIDKEATKQRVAQLGVAVPASLAVADGWSGPYPVVIKPVSNGSSFGVTIVRDQASLRQAVEEALRYDAEYVAEEYLSGREVTCAAVALGGEIEALPLVEIRPLTEFFDFEAKYVASQCEEICPAPIDAALTAEIQRQTVAVFQALGCRHYARADWIIQDGVPYFLEINTLPGMTKTSLIIKELAAAGIPYSDFIDRLLAAATSR